MTGKEYLRWAHVPSTEIYGRCHVLGSCPGHLFRSEEHTSELQSQSNLVCRLLLEKKNTHLDHARVELAAYQHTVADGDVSAADERCLFDIRLAELDAPVACLVVNPDRHVLAPLVL